MQVILFFFSGNQRPIVVPEFFKIVLIIVPGIPPFVELTLVYMKSLTLILSVYSVFLDPICPSQRVYMLLKMESCKTVLKQMLLLLLY